MRRSTMKSRSTTMLRTLTGLILCMLAAAPSHAQTEAPPPLTPPRLLNGGDVRAEVERNYPRQTRMLGVGGTALYRVFVDTAGKADTLRLLRSTGLAGLDAAARSALGTARFAPARRGERAVPIWIELPISFKSAAMDTAPAPQALAWLNKDETREHAQSHHPLQLREAKLGATVGVSLYVDSI